MQGRGVRKQELCQRVHNHSLSSHTHTLEHTADFLTLIIRAFGPRSVGEQNLSQLDAHSPLADWIMVMENEHLISILRGCRYQMSLTVWKRKSTLPLIWKQRLPISPRKRPDHVFSPRPGGKKTEHLETQETFWTFLAPEHGWHGLVGMHHIWISIIRAPLTLSDPARRELSLSCNVTPWTAAGSALWNGL